MEHPEHILFPLLRCARIFVPVRRRHRIAQQTVDHAAPGRPSAHGRRLRVHGLDQPPRGQRPLPPPQHDLAALLWQRLLLLGGLRCDLVDGRFPFFGRFRFLLFCDF